MDLNGTGLTYEPVMGRSSQISVWCGVFLFFCWFFFMHSVLMNFSSYDQDVSWYAVMGKGKLIVYWCASEHAVCSLQVWTVVEMSSFHFFAHS